MAASNQSDAVPLATLIHMVTIKLTPTNYLLWRTQVTQMLKFDSLLSIVDGSEPSPPPTITGDNGSAPNPAYSSWVKRHDRSLSLLLASLTEESLSEVLGLSTANDVWTTLEQVFCPATQSRANQLRDELQFLKRGSSSVLDYSRKFNTLVQQLNAIGERVSEADKSRWFLRGLGSQFRTFADIHLALSSTPNFRDQSWIFILSLFISECVLFGMWRIT